LSTQTTNKPGGIGAEAVRKATGHDWAHWLGVLDEAGAKNMNHQQIVAALTQRAPDMKGWWLQMVTVGYEQARGLRKKHEKPRGFEITRSKTVAAPVSAAFEAWTNARVRRKWIGQEKIRIRTATPDKSLRVAWSDGVTDLDVNFYPRGPDKSQIVVQHKKLNSSRQVEQKKTFWSERLQRLKFLLES